jgi:hypothetical protein
MKSRVELEIEAQQAQVAELFADPRNNPRWMDDIERVEAISGEPGQPGSVYRMVPAKGSFDFVATVLQRTLPTEVKLSLQSQQVSVSATDRFLRISDRRTRLISEEEFSFNGLFRTIVGLLARPSIANAHRRHMESFKRFVESQAAPMTSRESATAH